VLEFRHSAQTLGWMCDELAKLAATPPSGEALAAADECH
jgi:hypothetical protein